VASVVVIVMLFIARVGVSMQLLWVPILLLLIIALTTGLALICSCANLFYRDVKYLVEVVLTFGIFFTPVFYEARTFGKWAPILLANPISTLLEALNDVLVIHRSPDPWWLTYAAATSMVILFGGRVVFKKMEPLFAERI
jgi:ABC-type polysaccharide/polyol phosphate export permease